MRNLLLFLGSAALRGLAQPGWLGGWLVFLAAPLRVASWRRPASAWWDYAHGVLFWLIAFSFLAEVQPLMPLGAALVLGVMGPIEGWLARRLARRLSAGAAGALALAAAAWLQREWFVLGAGGVPWASWAWPLAGTPLLRGAAVLGEGGLILLVAAWGGAVAALPRKPHRDACAWAAAALLAAALLAPASPPAEGEIPCLAVQPNVRVEEKALAHLSPSSFFARQLALADAALERGARPRLIVWAETMWPFPSLDPAGPDVAGGVLRQSFPGTGVDEMPAAEIAEGQTALAARVLKLAPADALFVTGAHFYAPLPPGPPDDRLSPRSSETLVFGADGALRAHLPKTELVPFGERLPFGGRLPFARWLVDAIQRGSGLRPDFVRPPGAGPMRLDTLPALGVATCWENVFDSVFRRQAQAGAQAFLVLSNEDWYGDDSREMRQMIAVTRLRAVETGRAVLRVTNTGLTARIGADGGLVEGPPPGVERTWEVGLPWCAPGASTPYLRGGWLLLPLVAAAAVLLALAPSRKGRNSAVDHPGGEG